MDISRTPALQPGVKYSSTSAETVHSDINIYDIYEAFLIFLIIYVSILSLRSISDIFYYCFQLFIVIVYGEKKRSVLTKLFIFNNLFWFRSVDTSKKNNSPGHVFGFQLSEKHYYMINKTSIKDLAKLIVLFN